MSLRIALVFAFLFAAGAAHAQRLPALYAEAGGAAGAYSVGAEQIVFRSNDDGRRLAARLGAAVRAESYFEDGEFESVINVPVGLVASFSLGSPMGVATRFDAGGGWVLSRRQGAGYQRQYGGTRLSAPAYAETVLRVEPGRGLAVRGGVTLGGDRSFLFDEGGARVVLGVGIQL